VHAALERILSSPPFGRSSQLANFLRFVVEERLSPREEPPKEYELGRRVFGRGPDYDPRIDPIVRVQARQLRFKLHEYYETIGSADPIRIEMPKGSYLPELSFAAVEILDPEPGARPAAELPEKPVPAATATRSRNARWILVTAIFLIIAATGFVAYRFARTGQRGTKAEGRPSGRAENPVARDLYLTGKYYWNKRTPESLNQAVDYFTQAIVKDPGYAKAYSGLADCYNLLREYSAMPANEAWPRAIAAAKKAVELDDSSAEAHSSLGFALFYGALDTRNGEREFRRAIELEPNYEKAHHWYATSLSVLGRFQESLAEIERARALDPTSTSVLADKGYILYFGGRPDEAITLLKQVEAAEPASQSAHNYLAAIYLVRRDCANYLSEVGEAAALSKDAETLTMSAAARKGFAAGGSDGMYASILEVQKTFLKEGRSSHYAVAKAYALMRSPDAAMHELQAAIDNREMNILALGHDPVLAGLHSDARFQRLQQELTHSL
jgi:tetratricopeptide (TPR) repeat protein